MVIGIVEFLNLSYLLSLKLLEMSESDSLICKLLIFLLNLGRQVLKLKVVLRDQVFINLVLVVKIIELIFEIIDESILRLNQILIDSDFSNQSVFFAFQFRLFLELFFSELVESLLLIFDLLNQFFVFVHYLFIIVPSQIYFYNQILLLFLLYLQLPLQPFIFVFIIVYLLLSGLQV